MNQDIKYLLLAILFISLTFIPYIYWQEDIHISIHDNLDSNVIWVKMLLNSNSCWSAPNTIIEQPMNGIARSSIYATYDLSLLIFYLFGSFWGYVINKFIMATIALIGMFLLTKKHLLRTDTSPVIAILVAILYSLLPFWSFSASVAGVPLALWAFLNLRNKDCNLCNWGALLLYAFYSSLILVGIFLLLILGGLFIYDWVRKKEFNRIFFLGFFFLSICYIISHWPLFYMSFFTGDYVSHRTEFAVAERNTNVIKHFLNFIRYNDIYASSHALALQAPIIIYTTFTTLLLMLFKKKIDRKILILSLLLITITLSVSLLQTNLVSSWLSFSPMNFSRIFWLSPALWYMLFACSLFIIYKQIKWGKLLIIALVLLQLYNQIPYFEYIKNKDKLTYKQFFSENQFSEIRKIINKDQKDYHVISIGLHPSIAQYNGFYTLDGYFPDYPLDYKHKFGEIIHDELSKNKAAYEYFYNWGSRCYAFSSDLFNEMRGSGYLGNEYSPILLKYNFEKLNELGGEVYIISCTELLNSPKTLKFIKLLDNPCDYWSIYLYKVL